MTEHVILVDGDDREVGTKEKLEAHREGALHRAFSVFVFDAEGRLLLQKRAADKYHSGGLWSNTCCGHPRPGEPTAAAARRRLREEMGFDCALEEALQFVYGARFENGLMENEYDHVLLGEYSGSISPDALEVEDWRWVSRAELRRELRGAPDAYTFWFKTVIEEVERVAGRRFR